MALSVQPGETGILRWIPEPRCRLAWQALRPQLGGMEETRAENPAEEWWQIGGHQPDEQKVARLKRLAELLREWNVRLNLVSRKDVNALERHHIGHALLMARWLNWGPRTRVLDVGTGGGLPGLPLAILFPEVHFFLCDSVRKKTKAVEEIAQTLGLGNVTVINKRAEDLESTWEFIIGRAVTALPEFLVWTVKNLRPGGTTDFPNGILYLKGTRYVEELSAIGVEPWQVHALSEAADDPYFQDKFLLHLRADDLLARPELRPTPAAKKPMKKKKRNKPRRRDIWGEPS